MTSLELNIPSTSNELYLERLDAFTEKTLADIRTFSTRERIPYDQVRRHVAERHSQYLFGDSTPAPTRQQNVLNVLRSTSQTLESLQVTAGIQSFLLAINPNDAEEEGFLGGSSLGREFWRSLRGGGTAGAKALKSLAISALQDSTPSSQVALHGTGIPSRQRETAHSLKSEVYARVRTLLREVFDTSCHFTHVITRLHDDRSTSGVRNAEMKWTNHGNLNVYGVRLEGWPPGIPMQNPSTLPTSQNRELRDALASGTLRFCRINVETSVTSDGATPSYGPAGNPSDLSWAIVEEYTTPVPHAADTDRVAYREESTDYFPGVTDATSKSTPIVRERVYPVPSFGQNGPVWGGEADISTSDIGPSSNNKRQRLDG